MYKATMPPLDSFLKAKLYPSALTIPHFVEANEVFGRRSGGGW